MLSSLEKDIVNERKFSGHASCLPRVLAVVSAYCAADDWFAEGVVNSIYFDTPALSSYLDKANGDNLKAKLRLRWYGRRDDLAASVPSFLEVKFRLGAARRKERIEVDAPRALLVDEPFEGPALGDFVRGHAAALGIPLGLEWRPVCCISYSRRRFFDTPSHSRVSVDWDIRADRFDRARFPWAVPFALDAMVCEFKNDAGRPPLWAEAVRDAGLSYGSFSKYGECMRRLTEGKT